MCLTIPKKVVSVENGIFTVEDPEGHRQDVKSLVELGVGDYVITQQNVVIEKMPQEEAQEIFEMIRR